GNALEAACQSKPDWLLHRENLSADIVGKKYRPRSKELRPLVLILCLGGDGGAATNVIISSIQNAYCGIPMLAILEKPESDVLRQLVEAGVADFCLMPLRVEDLLARLKRWACCRSPGGLARRVEEHIGLQQIIGNSQRLMEVIGKIPKFA